jgi:plastocyanin
VKRLAALAAVFMLAAGACLGGAGPDERTVLVDYSHDEFASFFLRFYPSFLTVGQGDTLVFKQTWTGEPHTVTAGKILGKVSKVFHPYLEALSQGKPLPMEEPKDLEKEERKLPNAFIEEANLNQVAAQPCYIKSGSPPKPGSKPCANRKQPATFDGTYDYYNSGIIPYQGPQGNTFTVKLADDIKPGKYFFMCSVHGVIQSSEVTVKPKGSDIPSQEEVSKQARVEINQDARLLIKDYNAARKGRVTFPVPDGKPVTVRGAFAGVSDPQSFFGAINEFVPRRMTVKAGQKITWNMFGGHTISFAVPEYFPIIRVAKNGTVGFNPKLYPPAGGAPKPKLPKESEGPPSVDGGTYDGRGFWSSGLVEGFEFPYVRYSMRISRPGTYRYACLVHPPMVGTLTVTR